MKYYLYKAPHGKTSCSPSWGLYLGVYTHTHTRTHSWTNTFNKQKTQYL